jgi:LemA protein
MIVAIVVALIFFGIIFFSMYNGLIRKKNDVQNAFATIDVMLKKRYDLIPNLVETVKTFMNHEKELLTKVTELRASAMNPNVSADEKVNIENQLNKAMGNIMVAVERYPDLKSNTNFLQLQASFNEIEEQISAARRFYNSAVTELNNAVEMFPTNIVAGMMGLGKREFFEIPEVERKNVSAKQLFNS